MNRKQMEIVQDLLHSMEKTTDLLKEIVDDNLFVHVIKHQESAHMRNCVNRESYLFTEQTGLIVSHNFVEIELSRVPNDLFDTPLLNKYGIGTTMSLCDIRSKRSLLRYGWKRKEAIVDLVSEPVSLAFSCTRLIPFKEYMIHYEGFEQSGMHLIEYFNPHLFELQMNRVAK
jgi:hypothetical protein